MTTPEIAQNAGIVNPQYFIPNHGNYIQQQQPPAHENPGFLQRFTKGEPLTLGVVQILIGLTNVSLGIILAVSFVDWIPVSVYTGCPFWQGLLFLISGSLSVSAQKNGSLGLVKGSLAMNIFSTLSAISGIILYVIDLTNYYYYICSIGGSNSDTYSACLKYREGYFVFRTSTLAFLVILSSLEFFISISTSAFGCKAVCGRSSIPQTAQPMFVIQNGYTQAPNVHATQLTGMQMMQGAQIPYGMYTMEGNTKASGHTAMPVPDYE